MKAKQLAFNHLKVNSFLKETSKQSFDGFENKFSKKSQEDFDKYFSMLLKDETCKYMTGISGIINLCNNSFSCKFQGEVYKSFTKNPKRECLREKITRFERILEH